MQKMFNIYEEEGEEFTESAMLRELFERVQHPQLQDIIKALKVRFDMEGITYTQAANHLTATVSELPEYHLTHKVSASSSGAPRIRGGGGSGHNSNVKRKGGMEALNKGILMSDRSGFSWVLPELVRTVKRRQAAGVGFTKQEEERRCWQQATNFRCCIHCRATKSHEAYHFRVGVVKEQSNQQQIQ